MTGSERFEKVYKAFENRGDRDSFYMFYRLGYNDALKECLRKVDNDGVIDDEINI